MGILDIFEELRFILELLIAEQMIAWNFARRKNSFWLKLCLGMVLLAGIAVLYPIPKDLLSARNLIVRVAFSVGWYILTALFSMMHLKICYDLSWCDMLFIGIAGYSIQHIEYVIINEIFAIGICPDITGYFLLYAFVCIVSAAGLYTAVAKIFMPKLKACGGRLYEDEPGRIVFLSCMLVVLLMSSFMCQSFFLAGDMYGDSVNYLGAVSDLFNCMLVLLVQMDAFALNAVQKEKEIVRLLLYQRQQQYRMSKENIDLINHKCHDLKHQITALKNVTSEELGRYIGEVEDSVMIYDTMIKTDNEVLNTILSEKSLYCERHEIKLSCIVDAGHMDFMSTLDIYAMLGNALDNAIECVSRYQDKEKRVISLTIAAKGDFLCIQTNNYFDGKMRRENGLPVTTKRDKGYHGFGMKSMKHLAEKYGGTLITSTQDGIFMLQIILPMPPEFLRLLKEEKINTGH